MHDIHPPAQAGLNLLLIGGHEEFASKLAVVVAGHGLLLHATCTAEAIENVARNLPLVALIIDTDCPALQHAVVAQWVEKMKGNIPVLYLVAPARMEQIAFWRGHSDLPHDFVVAPYSPEEAAVRLVHALQAARLRGHASVLCMGNLVLDDASRRVLVNELQVELTPNEYRVLKCLLMHSSRPASKHVMISDLFPAQDRTLNVLEVYISRLRRKLSGANVRIRSVRHQGYLIELQHCATPE